MTAAFLALALAAAGSTTAASDDPPLEVIEAGEVDYDITTGRGVATGGVVLRRGAVTLRADAATYDTRTGEIEATGAVLLTDPGRAVAARSMHAVLDGPFEAHDVVAFLKDAPLDLSRCRTLDEARKTGRNGLTFGGALVNRPAPGGDAPDRYDVERARVTVCDCGGGQPSWEIRAHRADVIPGKRAVLWWPVFYITPRILLIHTPVPVLALPAIYLPLSRRQSGLLFPELTFGGNAGFGISQPLYLTFGESWDATVTADYLFGPTTHAMKGPGAKVEVRWSPVEGMHGHVRASVLHSTVHDWPSGVALPPGWNRIALSALHEQRVSDRTSFKIELGLIDDPLYLQDFTGDALVRGSEYSRSAVALTHRTDDLAFEADAAYHLPLLYLDSGSSARAPFGTFGTDLDTFHRVPAASLTLLPVPVLGPLQVSATAGVARFAPLRGVTGDEGANGIGPGERGWSASAVDAGERDGRWTPPAPGLPGERLAVTRTLVRAEVRAPVTWNRVLDVEPWVGATAAAYAFAADLGPQVDARGVAGLAVSTRIARTFGDGGGRVRHEIEPRLEWRGGTGQVGPGLPNYAYDEFDVALPPRVLTASGDVGPQRMLSAIPGAFSQLQLSVRNRLIAPAGALSNTFVDVMLGQDLDLATRSASETWARGIFRLGYFGAEMVARFRAFGATAPAGTPAASPPSRLDAFTELGTSATVSDARGDNVHASFIALGAGGSPRVSAGLEPFFDPRPFAESAVALGQVGVASRWSGATIAYEAYFNGRALAQPFCANKSTAPHVYQHSASLVWDSPCRCWKAGLTATWNECDERPPRLGFIIDLSSLGSPPVPR